MTLFSLNPFINRGVIMLADICAIFVAIGLVIRRFGVWHRPLSRSSLAPAVTSNADTQGLGY
jgi:hypothetical protein